MAFTLWNSNSSFQRGLMVHRMILVFLFESEAFGVTRMLEVEEGGEAVWWCVVVVV